MAAYSVADQGRVGTLLALIARFGTDGVLRLRYKTLCRNLRLPAKTPVKLLDFLGNLEKDLLLDDIALDGDMVELVASEWMFPQAARQAAETPADFTLDPLPLDDVGRPRSSTRDAQNERQRRKRDRDRDIEAKLNQFSALDADADTVTLPVTGDKDVTAFRAQMEAESQAEKAKAVQSHSPQPPSDPSDRIDSDLQDFYKISNRVDQSDSNPKGSGETAVTLGENGRDISQTAVTSEGLLREIAADLREDKDGWTEVELTEALERFAVQNDKRDIPRKLNYVRTILRQLRDSGFDQQRAGMLHGAVPGGMRTRPPSSDHGLRGKYELPEGGVPKLPPRTGTEG